MKSRISRPVARKVIPARETHVHPGCGHGCDCYRANGPLCRECRNKQFNESRR